MGNNLVIVTLKCLKEIMFNYSLIVCLLFFNKAFFQLKLYSYFSYSPRKLAEPLLMNKHNMFLWRNKNNYLHEYSLSGAMIRVFAVLVGHKNHCPTVDIVFFFSFRF